MHLIVVAGQPADLSFRSDARGEPAGAAGRRQRVEALAGRSEPWNAREDLIEIPGSRYVDWLIPGIISLSIMNNGLWSIGFMTVQARLRKLLKRLAASPDAQARLPHGSRPRAPGVSGPRGCGATDFRIRWRSAYRCGVASSSIAAIAIAGALMFGALGLLMGSRVRTFEAASGLMNLLSVPMWVLSGVFFSASNFPDAVQPFIQALPLTALVDAMRGVVLEGATLTSLWNELAIITAWTVVPFAIALKIFKWR